MAIDSTIWSPNIPATTKMTERREIKEFGLLLSDGREKWQQTYGNDGTWIASDPVFIKGNSITIDINDWSDDPARHTTVASIQKQLDEWDDGVGFKAYVLTRTRFVYEYLTDAKVHFTTARGVVSHSLSELNVSEVEDDAPENDCLEDYR